MSWRSWEPAIATALKCWDREQVTTIKVTRAAGSATKTVITTRWTHTVRRRLNLFVSDPTPAASEGAPGGAYGFSLGGKIGVHGFGSNMTADAATD